MQLHQSTWQEVEQYLKRSTAIVIPVGSTEQHGPNGLLGTDALCPEAIAKAAGDRMGTDMLVGPTFNVGVAQHHLGFPGTITLRPSTMIAAMRDWSDSLIRHGFDKLFWLNGHGGNVATIQAAFAEIYGERSLAGEGSNRPPVMLNMCNWWDLPGIQRLCEELYPTGHGSHATPAEVSVTYAAFPDAVKNVTMEPKIAPRGPIRDAADYRRRFPDGRIGSDPSQASVEDGEKLIDASATALIEKFRTFTAQPE